MSEWIDVKHRLPELDPRNTHETVVVFVTGTVTENWANPFAGAKLVDGSWCAPDGYPLRMEVSHWCAMPAACRLVWDEGKPVAIPDLAVA